MTPNTTAVERLDEILDNNTTRRQKYEWLLTELSRCRTETLQQVAGLELMQDEKTGLPVTQAQEQACYDKNQRNKLRAELRQKLKELESK